MLYLFFTIVFIAELIILERIISGIVRFDKKVCNMNCKVLTFQSKIKDDIKLLRSVINAVLDKLDCFVTFLATKRTDCGKQIKKSLLMTVLGFILRIPTKKIMTIVDILFMVRRLWKRA
jgi:hypothetical protein